MKILAELATKDNLTYVNEVTLADSEALYTGR
jgi:hypothetical protein